MSDNSESISRSSVGLLVRSMSHAVQTVSNMMSEMNQNYFNSFFEIKDGVHTPKKLLIDRGDVSKKFASLGLQHYEPLEMTDVSIDLKVNLEDINDIKDMEDYTLGSSKITIGGLKKDNMCNITMNFKKPVYPNESVSKVIDFLDNIDFKDTKEK